MFKYNVNIDLANKTKKEMEKSVGGSDERILNSFSAFSSLYDIKFDEYEHPVLVQKTEEPGSKQLLAMQYDRIEGVCYDMIHHLINDCIVMGAKPLTVQDAIICGRLNKDIVTRIVDAISSACSNNSCILTGGETSEQPGVLNEDVYILTSSITGIVDKEKIIDGSKICIGDKVISLESSGVHTNGYTLVRDIISKHNNILDEKVNDKKFIDAILEPHRCYYNTLKDLFEKKIIKGMAHITGGGIRENLNRILPKNCDAEIDLNTYDILEVFKVIKKYGNISDDEMLRTFNLGVGLVLISSPTNVEEICNHIEQNGVKCTIIGKIVSGSGNVNCKNRLIW